MTLPQGREHCLTTGSSHKPTRLPRLGQSPSQEAEIWTARAKAGPAYLSVFRLRGPAWTTNDTGRVVGSHLEIERE